MQDFLWCVFDESLSSDGCAILVQDFLWCVFGGGPRMICHNNARLFCGVCLAEVSECYAILMQAFLWCVFGGGPRMICHNNARLSVVCLR